MIFVLLVSIALSGGGSMNVVANLNGSPFYKTKEACEAARGRVAKLDPSINSATCFGIDREKLIGILNK